jgi:hypothetical protein
MRENNSAALRKAEDEDELSGEDPVGFVNSVARICRDILAPEDRSATDAEVSRGR